MQLPGWWFVGNEHAEGVVGVGLEDGAGGIEHGAGVAEVVFQEELIVES